MFQNLIICEESEESDSSIFQIKDEIDIEYNCFECQQGFTFKTDLEKHLETHKIIKSEDLNKKVKVGKHKVLKGTKDIEEFIPFEIKDEIDFEYNCFECHQIFTFKTDLEKHLKTHKTTSDGDLEKKLSPEKQPHKKEDLDEPTSLDVKDEIDFEYNCIECHQLFSLETELKNHLKTHSNQSKDFVQEEVNFVPIKVTRWWNCNICENRFRSRKVLAEHIGRVHLNKTYNCDMCPSKLRTKRGITKHVIKHMNSELYTCEVCYKTFEKKRSLKIHKESHITSRAVKCQICQKGFQTKRNLRLHLTYTHGTQKPFKCSKCEVSFNKKSTLKTHTDHVHLKVRKFKCNKCNFAFTKNGNLKKHDLAVHSGIRAFECTTCGNFFKTNSDLKSHHKSHTNIRPFKCNQCENSYKSQFQLKMHLNSHAGIKPYKCNECQKSFTCSSSLKCHQKKPNVHIEKIPQLPKRPPFHQCPKCELTFKLKKELQQHNSDAHVKPRPEFYECANCDLKFNLKKDLLAHKEVHANLKPYICDKCGRDFQAINLLKSHLTSHLESKPFKCSRCDRSFKTEANLKVHENTYLNPNRRKKPLNLVKNYHKILKAKQLSYRSLIT